MVFVALARGCHTFSRRSEVALVFFYYFFYSRADRPGSGARAVDHPRARGLLPAKEAHLGCCSASCRIFHIQYTIYIFEYIHMPLGLMEETQS